MADIQNRNEFDAGKGYKNFGWGGDCAMLKT